MSTNICSHFIIINKRKLFKQWHISLKASFPITFICLDILHANFLSFSVVKQKIVWTFSMLLQEWCWRSKKINLVIDIPYLPQCTTSSIAKSINSTTQDFNYMLHYNSKEHVLEFLSQRTKQGYNNKRSRTELNKPWSLEGAVTAPMVTVVYKMADIAMLILHVINKTKTEII